MKKLTAILGLALLLTLAMSFARAQDQNQDAAQDPDEIKDTLQRAKAKGVLTACADPCDWPYSQRNGVPPGFDVEIFQQLARMGGMRAEIYWADTGTRGLLPRFAGARLSCTSGPTWS